MRAAHCLTVFVVIGLPIAAAQAAAPNRPDAKQGIQRFETEIAPLLATHCLECHDSATRQGGLDLSRHQLALKGGENGAALVPGKAAESLVWQYVESDQMPADRPSLSSEEKQQLRKWIDEGAAWSLAVIDPAVYVQAGHAGEQWIQRLTVPEYIATVQAAVDVDISKEARELLPPDLRADGFSNTAYNLNIDLKHVEAYARLAEIIVGRMDVPKFAARFSKSRKLSTDDTMREHVEAMGKWLLRGPLEEREEVNFSGIATTVASAGGNFDDAMSCIIEAMLQSPRFIYRVENQSADGKLQPHELACRLSYILWGASPDAELMRAAEKGELADRAKLTAQVQRMLKDPRAVERSKLFIYDWLDLGRVENMRPNPALFPHWSDELARDMRDETLAYFEEVVWKQQRPLADLLNAQFTYATPRLAEHYGLKPQSKEQGAVRYDLTSVAGRGGILTHGSVLTIGGDDASMVTRGLFVLQELLRGVVKDPPPCVDTTPQPTRAGLTRRGIAEARVSNVNCGGCHSKFEPLAYGLERYDGIGGYHEVDEFDNPLREDGQILFPGSAEPVGYPTSAELMDLLAAHERVRESITWKLTQFALGRPLGAADAATVQQINSTAQEKGGTYASTMTAIALSDLVAADLVPPPRQENRK